MKYDGESWGRFTSGSNLGVNRCPECGRAVTYQGLTTVECESVVGTCRNGRAEAPQAFVRGGPAWRPLTLDEVLRGPIGVVLRFKRRELRQVFAVSRGPVTYMSTRDWSTHDDYRMSTLPRDLADWEIAS